MQFFPKSSAVPEFESSAFPCPFCGVYAKQDWYSLDLMANITPKPGMPSGRYSIGVLPKTNISRCQHCGMDAIWKQSELVFPRRTIGQYPSFDMPVDVKVDYLEARKVAADSPRSAAALLRLALQKLMPHLNEKGKRLDDDIASLVKKGLPVQIQQSLDCVRVIGNNAVHPGEMDILDNLDTVTKLFEILNLIVNVMITTPKKVDALYGTLPAGAIEAIEKRDK